MSVLPDDDPDRDLSWKLYFDCILKWFNEENLYEQKRRKREIDGPKSVRFRKKGPDYGDGCYNIKGNIDLRGFSDRIVKFLRNQQKLKP